MRGLYRVAEAGRPACMTDPEYALWHEANAWHPAVSVKSPCSDCPLSFAEAMRAVNQCDGTPLPPASSTGGRRPLAGPVPEFLAGRGVRYATEEERIAARRASWRASAVRKRLASRPALAMMHSGALQTP